MTFDMKPEQYAEGELILIIAFSHNTKVNTFLTCTYKIFSSHQYRIHYHAYNYITFAVFSDHNVQALP